MSGTVYKVIELVGTSDSSWEEAAKNAVETAGKSLKDLRVAEVKELDVKEAVQSSLTDSKGTKTFA